MSTSSSDKPKIPTSSLHVVNLIVAICAGLISVIGGVYSIKTNIFTPKTGSVQGIIRDSSIAKPLWLAQVELSKPEGALISKVDTDKVGHYSFESLRAGDYVIKVSAPMHQIESRNIQVLAGSSSTVNFELNPETPEPKAALIPAQQEIVPPAIPTQNPYYPPQAQPQMPPYANQDQNQGLQESSQDSMFGRRSPYGRRGFHRRPGPYVQEDPSLYSQNQEEMGESSGQTQSASLSGVLTQLVAGFAEKKLAGSSDTSAATTTSSSSASS